MSERDPDLAAALSVDEGTLGAAELLERIAQRLLGDIFGSPLGSGRTGSMGVAGRGNMNMLPMMRTSLLRQVECRHRPSQCFKNHRLVLDMDTCKCLW